jgi:hypothetical protein
MPEFSPIVIMSLFTLMTGFVVGLFELVSLRRATAERTTSALARRAAPFTV